MKFFIWSNWCDSILSGESPPELQGGAELQMAFWAKAIASQGHTVYGYTNIPSNHGKVVSNVKFFYYPLIRKVGVFLIYLRPLLLLFVKTDYVLVRLNGNIGFLRFISRIKSFKIIYMLASDAIVMESKDKSILALQKHLKEIDFVVAQTSQQQQNFNKVISKRNIPVISNIWDSSLFVENPGVKEFDFIWVGNFKKNKRPEWILSLASQMPDKKFAVIGGPLDQKVYDNCRKQASNLPNVTFYGPLPVRDTTALIAKSRILVNTSVIEGFPNTFLQAWSYGLPVMSAVNPSYLVSEKKLGLLFETEDQMKSTAVQLLEMIQNPELESCILNYFNEAHNPVSGVNKLVTAIS